MALHKIFKILMIIIAVAGLIMAGYIWTLDSEALQTAVKAGGVDSVDTPWINAIMGLSWITLGIILVLVLIFVLKGLFSGNAKNTLIGIGAFVLVIAIAYFTASGVETPMKDGEMLSANGSKWVSAGINAFYILAAVAIGLMVFSGVKKLAK